MTRSAAALLSATPTTLAQTPPTATQAPAPTPPTEQIRHDGLIADYFAADPATAHRGALIVLGGSEGGLGGARGLARRLAAGFSAIAVSYFGEPGQSERLDQISIEPVGRALDWLRARPGAADQPVAVVGVSKGGELALLVASRDPRITAVVAGVPSNVV